MIAVNPDKPNTMHMHKILSQLAIAVFLALNSSNLMAQNDGVTTPQPRHRQYTKEHPLVYEDVWDLWPYSFLNDNGEPEGYNIDLIRLMMDRLNIPYVIKLRTTASTSIARILARASLPTSSP